MRYNPRARLNRGQVSNRRGGGGFGGGGFGGGGLGGGGFPMGRRRGGGGMRVGGGLGGLVVLVIFIVLQLSGGGGGGGTQTGPGLGSGSVDSGVQGSGTGSLEQCQTGADANQEEDCALVADVNSIQAFWAEELPRQAQVRYTESQTTIFSGGTQTGCGNATSDTGPFYCPADQGVYLDTTFFDDMLEGRLGARGGQFATSYVLAHEYGHHVQDLMGTMRRVRTQQGANSDAVRLELQADCYAGMWAKAATTVPDAGGQPYILDLTQDDIDRALNAAAAVGDDRIQQRSGGRVDPESWSHGSAEQRQRWFSTGLREGDLQACDTFTADRL